MRGIIDSRIQQWQRYREMAEKLRKWLLEMSCQPVTELGSAPIPLQQARVLLDEVQVCAVCLKKKEKNPCLFYSLHHLKCLRFSLSALPFLFWNWCSIRSVMEAKAEFIKNMKENLVGSFSQATHASAFAFSQCYTETVLKRQ